MNIVLLAIDGVPGLWWDQQFAAAATVERYHCFHAQRSIQKSDLSAFAQSV